MTSPLSAETTQHALVTLWHETTQAHFLQSLAVSEALIVLQERHERIRRLLQLGGEQEQRICSPLMQDHFHLLLKAELSWIKRAISVLRERSSHPNEDRENTESAKSQDY
jgi:hypothetical protein